MHLWMFILLLCVFYFEPYDVFLSYFDLDREISPKGYYIR